MASHSEFNKDTSGAEVVSAFTESVTGKTFVITGPTPGGLGVQTALFLASSKPSTILLLGRDEFKAAPAVQSVKAASPSTTVEFIHCDLGVYSSIRSAAKTILTTTPKIHALINNAGVMAPAEYRTTPEGVEVQFGANHIGHFLLTNLLMPSILAAASEGARIVNLSSMGWGLGDMRFDDYNFNSGKDWEKWAAYGQSKTANILFTVELAKRLKSKGVHAYAIHPGMIYTNLGREMDVEKDVASLAGLFNARGYVKVESPMPWKTLETGTSTTLVAALDPALRDHSGVFLSDCQITETADYTTNLDDAEKLWVLSEKIVGEKFDL